MRISVDLRHDEIVDLHKALSLISQAVAERTGQAPTIAPVVQQAAPQSAPMQQQAPSVQQTPTIDSLRQNQQQPSSTGLFAPRQAQPQAAPPNRWDVNQTTPRSAQPEKKESATESFGMLNMLGRKR